MSKLQIRCGAIVVNTMVAYTKPRECVYCMCVYRTSILFVAEPNTERMFKGDDATVVSRQRDDNVMRASVRTV